ncbi:MAG: hypothetical protein HY560_13275 [Gemmatimonadetes bacterium]|nr:hypothetical protein [Gemmatimonadota bacterium]
MVRGYQTLLDSVRVRVNHSHVMVLQERRLSRARTYPVVGGAVALVATFFVTRGLVGRGTPPEGTPPPPPTDNSVRAP